MRYWPCSPDPFTHALHTSLSIRATLRSSKKNDLMKRRNVIRIFGSAVLTSTVVPRTLFARCHHHGHTHWHPPILPHIHPLPHVITPVQVNSVDVSVSIRGRMATTTMTMTLHNPGHRQQESEVLIPVPNGASIVEYGLEGAQGKFPAKLIPRDEARRIYDEIVRRSLDPALLEFAGNGLVQSSVFPVPARGTSRVRLIYEEVLEMDGDRIDYALPRTESPHYKVPWSVSVDWSIPEGLAAVYSPSHHLSEKRVGPKRMKLKNAGEMQVGSLLLSATRRKLGHVTASVMAYPDARQGKDSGFFLLLLSPPEPKEKKIVKREVTVVIDKSGSMAGEKMEQALKASTQIIEGLEDGEAFNIIVYNEAVELFADKPVVKDRATTLAARKYLSGVRVSGGTNIHDALNTAVLQKPSDGMLPIVLFLTDGMPTIGQTNEKKIRDVIAANNIHKRRIFTFGVGTDVNTPLLSRLADDSRARATYVLPKENVELKVAGVFRRLSGPVLGEPTLITLDKDEKLSPADISDVLPGRLPDMFAGEQVVVLGRYHDTKQLRFRLLGQAGQEKRKFRFSLKLKKARNGNAHVPRLWATRKIALLTEALRDFGAESSAKVNMSDPKIKELVDEIVRLSTEYGVLTEYTAFLAREGMVFAQDMHRRAVSRATAEIQQKAVRKRTGQEAFNQDWNIGKSKGAVQVNRSNYYLDAKLENAKVDQVCQVADKAFYRKGNEWVDADLAGKGKEVEQATPVKVTSPEFKHIVDQLVKENRQSCLALGSNIRVVVNGKNYLITSGK